MKKLILTLILLFCIQNSIVLAEDITLVFKKSDKKVVTIDLQDLKTKLKTHKIEFFDPHYNKTKRFKAFALQDVLNLGFKNNWSSDKYTDIGFKALDGYNSVSKIGLLNEDGGYLTFEDFDFPSWEPIGRNKANPAPFYLVWLKENQTTEFGYPWPWQLKEINLTTFKDQYPKVYPDGVAKNSSEFVGFSIFKERCVRCHSIDNQGGKIGPDLNAPKNILEYRSQDMVKEFIKNPSEYRYTHMPDHKDLSDQDLDNLIRYFLYLDKNKMED